MNEPSYPHPPGRRGRPPGRIRALPGRPTRLPLHKGVYVLPNLFTTGGLFLGFYSILASSRGDFFIAAVCIVAAHVCDGLDGRIARMTNTTSLFGMEYDSLADMVSFGVAPGILAYRWGLEPWGHWGWLAASLFATCGALRLARFNVQSTHASKRTFVGLPIPAAANMIAASVLLQEFLAGPGPTAQRPIVLFMVYALALLMVSSVPYASFKNLDLRAQQPFYALVATIFVVKFVLAEPQIMLFGALLAYVGSGPVNPAVSLVRRPRRLAAHQRRREAAGDGNGRGTFRGAGA